MRSSIHKNLFTDDNEWRTDQNSSQEHSSGELKMYPRVNNNSDKHEMPLTDLSSTSVTLTLARKL